MPIFFHQIDKQPGVARRFIAYIEKRYFNAASLTADEVKDPEYMICAIMPSPGLFRVALTEVHYLGGSLAKWPI